MDEDFNSEPISLALIKKQLEPLCYKDGKTIRSYQQFFKLYYYIRLLKYSTQSQLRSIKFSGVSKVATRDIIHQCVKFGHISTADKNGIVFVPNEVTDQIVKKVNYNDAGYIKVFANLPAGTETSNEIKNTEVFIQALKADYFYFILFPDFNYVRPDALIILKNESMYKLIFVEVETEQSNWQNRLDRMRENYLRLCKDKLVYDFWKQTATLLNLPIPDINDFKFSVKIISSIYNNWGEGFEFKQKF